MSRNGIDVRSLLDAPHWPRDRQLDAILGSLLQRRSIPLPAEPPPPAALWPASSFGLDRLTLFDGDETIVARCAIDRLNEALTIEKLGLSFCAKMTLLATSEEERMLYSMIAADEATHFFWLSHFVAVRESCETTAQTGVSVPHQSGACAPDTREHDPSDGSEGGRRSLTAIRNLGTANQTTSRTSPFLALLSELIENGSQAMLTMLIQVVLEGWGMAHYRMLAHDCAHPELQNALKQIVTDEARHHGSGSRLMGRREIGPIDRDAMIEALTRLLAMVGCGPQSVVASIGPRTHEEAIRCFMELDSENESRRKLALLAGLIEEANVDGVMTALQSRGAFTAMTAEECAGLCSIS